MIKKYYINYHTGAGNFELEGTLEEAIKEAEKGLAYTQQPVSIELDGEEVAYLPWWGTKPTENDIVTAQFGDYGFYGEWTIID